MDLKALRWANAALVLLLTVYLLHALWPGWFDLDALLVYRQAQDPAVWEDKHSVVLTLLMALSQAVAPGPAPLFVASVILFMVGLLLLSDALIAAGRPYAGLAATAFGASPLCTFLLLDVNKDSWLGAVGLLIVGLLARAALLERRSGRLVIGAAAALMVVFVGLRLNALVAAAPLVGAFAWIGLAAAREKAAGLREPDAPRADRPLATQPLRWLAVVAALLVLLVIADRTLKYGVARANRNHSERTLLLFDIAGASRFAGEDLSRGIAGPTFWPRLQECYTPALHDAFEFGECREIGAEVRKLAETAEGRSRIKAAWFGAVTQRPGAYLRHRLHHYDALMGLWTKGHHYMTDGFVTQRHPWAENAVIPKPTAAGLAWQGAAFKAYDGWMGRGAVWLGVLLACAAALAPRLWRMRPTGAAVLATALTLTGLGYMLAYFFVGIAFPLRYLHWSILTAGLAAIVALSVTLRPGPRTDRAESSFAN
jgi:hypothetical protein